MRETTEMDVLSEVLRAVKLRGALFFNGEFSAPWCFRSERSALAAPALFPLLRDPERPHSDASRLILFHFLTEGRAYARLPDGSREDLSAGDIVILPHGDAHFLGNGSPEKPVDSFVVFAENLAQGIKVARFGGGGEITRFVCGFMACEPRLSEVFLVGLPPILKVHVANEPSGQWLAHSIRFTVDQAGVSSSGSSLVLAKLSEVLFVEALRCYVNTMPADRTGWLAGVRDPVIGRALALLHKEPSRPWTIPDLAKRTGLSRTRLVERFRHFVDDSPIAYLNRWRMKLGAEMLQSTEQSVAEIAEAIGYGSESAFNRAFRREFGCPPAQFRRKRYSQ
ncbi:MAG: AraC family transcriptional regulator [Bryobacteraceae bacterium]